ncbi:MAG: TonB-dependent receptor [Cruoricaptor ignavus]|nr:TonB-dependent receptor [Cruoricaptor ignavus]
MKKTTLCVVLLGVLLSSNTYAISLEESHIYTQRLEKQTSLVNYLKKLKQKSNFSFLYSDSDLRGIMITEPKNNIGSVVQILDDLKAKKIIDYKITGNNISIRRSQLQTTQTGLNPASENRLAVNTKLATDTIAPKEKAIDEVVLIGYGTRRKSEITGSAASVKAEDMKSMAGGNISDMVVGKAAGVQVVNDQAAPGSAGTIKLRGTSTINAGSDPLIVVDGFPLSEGSNINSIDPNSIETMDFLKDAASTAIYGSRGANGVIMIKTKEGRKGRVDISLNSTTSFQSRADNVKLVNAYDFAQYQWEARNNGYISKDPANRFITDDNATRRAKGAGLRELIPDYILPYLRGEKGLTDTDWLKEVFRVAPMQNHSVNITGGSENTNFAITGTYFKQDGIMIGSDYERMSTVINLISKINNKLRVGVALNPSYSSANVLAKDGWHYNPFNMALISYPFFPAYNADGTVAISEQFAQNASVDGALVENPLAMVKYVSNKQNIFRLFGNTFAEYKIARPLTYKLSIGGDYQNNNNNRFHPNTVGRYRTPASAMVTEAERNTSIRKNYLIENLLTFNKRFGSHSLEAIAGQSYQNEKFEGTTINADGFPDNSLTNISGGTNFKVVPSEYSWALISYFARANYAYDAKYLLSASIRRDGSSRFGMNTKWANFSALSAGWVVSKENFFPQNNVLTNLKLRASWGQSGNNQIDNFGALALMRGTNYNFGGTLAPGYSPYTSPNPNLTWESATSTNFGVDLAFFRNFIGINADYYVARNKDLLLNVPVPYQSGYQSSLQNIGELKNEGFELVISTLRPVRFGDFRWTSSLNLSTNKNTILSLAPGQQQILAGALNYSINRVGGSLSELYGYEILGVYKNQAEINATPHIAGTLVGDYIFADLNGDGKIDANDKKSFGRTSPNLIGGFNSSLSYKNWDFSFTLYGESGKQIYSRTLASLLEAGEGFSMISQHYFDNRFIPGERENALFGAPNLGNFTNNRREARISNLFFKDASYLRLRTVKLTYTLPRDYASIIGMKSAQFFVMANNLFTWTKYKGFNVDSDSANPLAQGYDDANYPAARVYSFGVNFNF